MADPRAISAFKPPIRSHQVYADGALDVTGAGDVEVLIRQDGRVLWINASGRMLLRICRIEGTITVEDNRDHANPKTE